MIAFYPQIEKVLDKEGIYSDDNLDSGGKTKFGITEKVAREFGYRGEMVDFPKVLAIEIIQNRYWEPMELGVITKRYSERIPQELLDTAVNMGTHRAGVLFQRCLNVLNDRNKLYDDVKVDGVIGPKTLHALSRFLKFRHEDGEEVLLKALNCLQGAFYIELAEEREKDERFVYGWLKNRVEL